MRVTGTARTQLRIIPQTQQTTTTKSKHIEADVWIPGRRDVIRRALRDLDQRIALRESEVNDARIRRRRHRRMAVVMSLMTLASSAVTLILMFGPAAPLTTAIWVVPSAFGGSSVSQSIAAIMESRAIQRLRHEIDGLRAVRNELSLELRAFKSA